MNKLNLDQVKADRLICATESSWEASQASLRREERIPDLEAALIEAVEVMRKAQKYNADFAYIVGVDAFLERFQ